MSDVSVDSSAAPILRFDRVSKRFGGTLAVDGVSLALFRGEIMALLGENGAGKSTMIKTLAKLFSADGGRILVDGAPYAHRPAKAGRRQKVAFIHQDLGLISWRTVEKSAAMRLVLQHMLRGRM